MERIRAKQEKHRESRARRGRPQSKLDSEDPGQEPGGCGPSAGSWGCSVSRHVCACCDVPTVPPRPVPCHLPLSLWATWPPRYHPGPWTTQSTQLPAHNRLQRVRVCHAAPLSLGRLPSLSPHAHPAPSTGPGHPGTSSPPQTQWWRPWLDHATGTPPCPRSARCTPPPMPSCPVLSCAWDPGGVAPGGRGGVWRLTHLPRSQLSTLGTTSCLSPTARRRKRPCRRTPSRRRRVPSR